MIEQKTKTVTPALAAEWLARNSRNMPARKDRVALIAKDLEAAGKFQTNTPIALFDDGTIYYGHTRLSRYSHIRMQAKRNALEEVDRLRAADKAERAEAKANVPATAANAPVVNVAPALPIQ
ncbi:MAG: hypothetical protein P4K98_01890 [Bryobacteraceae bacterium]|nr:hypothetical protein [Bryobacteraceae bacterium]